MPHQHLQPEALRTHVLRYENAAYRIRAVFEFVYEYTWHPLPVLSMSLSDCFGLYLDGVSIKGKREGSVKMTEPSC